MVSVAASLRERVSSVLAGGAHQDSLVTDDSSDGSHSSAAHHGLGHLLHAGRHRRREHSLAKIRVGAGGDDLVRLLHKVELEQLVGLVEDEVADAVGREGQRGSAGAKPSKLTWWGRRSQP